MYSVDVWLILSRLFNKSPTVMFTLCWAFVSAFVVTSWADFTTIKHFTRCAITIPLMQIKGLLAFDWTKGSVNLLRSLVVVFTFWLPLEPFGLKCRQMTSTEFCEWFTNTTEKKIRTKIFAHGKFRFFFNDSGFWIIYNEVMRVRPKTDLNLAFHMFTVVVFLFSTCQSPGIETIHFDLVCMHFCQHQHVCAHGLNIAFSVNKSWVRKNAFASVTHLLWTTQLVCLLVNTIYSWRSSGEKMTSETFPFIDIVNRSNFDPVRLIISRTGHSGKVHKCTC